MSPTRNRGQKRAEKRKEREILLYKPDDLTQEKKMRSCKKLDRLKKKEKECMVCPVPFCWRTFKNRIYLTKHYGNEHRKFPLNCNTAGCESRQFASAKKWKSHQIKVHLIKNPRMERLPRIFSVKGYLENFEKGEIPYYELINKYYKEYVEQAGNVESNEESDQSEAETEHSNDNLESEKQCDDCKQLKLELGKLEQELLDAGKLVEWQEKDIGNFKEKNDTLLKKTDDMKKIIESQVETIRRLEAERDELLNGDDEIFYDEVPIDIEYKYNI